MRYVITPDIAVELAEREATLGAGVELVAPTLLRSEVLAQLYSRVRTGELDRRRADELLDAVRRFKIRLLGDRVLQAKAWGVAESLDWADTYRAEYVALTRLQADAFVTGDAELAAAAADLVTVASFDDLVA
ncbi:MAG: hypothetical protein AAFZ07_21855 [Actinomycetota bacterium]